MIFQKTNLQEALIKEEKKVQDGDSFVAIAESILEKESEKESGIRSQLKNGSYDPSDIPSQVFEQDKVFSEAAIKNICIKYRLRFLPTKYYRGEFPSEAIMRIKYLEQDHGIELKNFKIVAPDKRFQLKDSTADPMLFLPLDHGKYYLIHQWGADMAPSRNWLNLPLRNLKTLFSFCIGLAFLITLMIPSELFVDKGNLLYLSKAFSFFLISVFLVTASLIYGITNEKEFSADQWNSKFFN